MAGLPHLLGQHLREAAECVARGATAGSRVRLLRDTVRFHLRNRLVPGARPGGANRYDVRIASRRVELHLRPYAGDFFVFHEIFVDRPYAIPAAWQRDVRTVVDLGAHVGLTSLFFLEQLPQARLVCVEAAPDNAELLRRNLGAFSDRVTILEAAVGPASGVARFPVAGHSWGRAARFDADPDRDRSPAAIAGGGQAAGETVEIASVSMDEVLRRAGLDRVDLLKVDVEGAEALLFDGPMRWLDAVGLIVIELHEPYTLAAFARAVGRAGFRTLTPSDGLGNRMPMALSPAWAGRAGIAR